jgi:hypothetical protein
LATPISEALVGDWTRLHNEELHNLYASRTIIRVIKSRKMRWADHVAPLGEMENAYKIFVGKSEGNKALGRPMLRWKLNIEMDLRGMGWKGVVWMHLVQDRDQWRAVVNTVMNLWIP